MEFSEEVTCRLRIRTRTVDDSHENYDEAHDFSEISNEIRKKWVDELRNFIDSNKNTQQIRPIDFILYSDGSVENTGEEPVENPTSASDTSPKVYPSPYRIPPETIQDLDIGERVRRAELFALGGLIYEIHQGKRPFQGLDDGEIQRRYRNAEFPDVVCPEPGLIILSCWSVEFARALYQIIGRSFLSVRSSHINFYDPHLDQLNNPRRAFSANSRGRRATILNPTLTFLHSKPLESPF